MNLVALVLAVAVEHVIAVAGTHRPWQAELKCGGRRHNRHGRSHHDGRESSPMPTPPGWRDTNCRAEPRGVASAVRGFQHLSIGRVWFVEVLHLLVDPHGGSTVDQRSVEPQLHQRAH